MEQKDNYIVINGINYYPAHKENVKNVKTCFYCSFYDDDNCDCKLKDTGIKCERDSYFVRLNS